MFKVNNKDRGLIHPYLQDIQADIYLLKLNNKNTRTRSEICSNLKIKTLAIRVVLVSLSSTLNK